MADRFLHVGFCCNDGHNGMFQGWFDSIEVRNSQGSILDCDCMMLDEEEAPSLAFQDNAVVIADVRYPKRNYYPYEGNWCWDSVDMTVGDVRNLLRHLVKLGWWIGDQQGDFPELEEFIQELQAEHG